MYIEHHSHSSSLGLPGFVPLNLEFQVDDFEKEWNWHKPFDLIHARMLGGCIGNPARFFKEAFTYVTLRLLLVA
jgi:hypothetical protein